MENKALASLFAEAAVYGWNLHSDVKEWLELFSERLKEKADVVTNELQKLLEFSDSVEQELFNTFNKFRELSNTQFIENCVCEDDETISTFQQASLQEHCVPSQSFENDIVPRYKEALSDAWASYQELITRPCRNSLISDEYTSRILRERWKKQLPHIIGTDEFMRDSSCGIVEEQLSGFKAFVNDSEIERDDVMMAAQMAGSGFLPGKWSESELDISHDSDRIGAFEPAVSAALDFKAMLEAALRSPYISCDTGMLSSKENPFEYLKEPSVSSIIISENIHRNMPEEGITKQEDWKLVSSKTGIVMDEKAGDLENFENHLKNDSILVPPAVQSNIETHDSTSKQIDAKKVSTPNKITDPEKSFSEHIQHHHIGNLFHSSVISGGLLDDDELDPGKRPTGSGNLSSPSVLDQVYTNLHMHQKGHVQDSKINLMQPDLAKPDSSAISGEGNDIAPERNAGAFSQNKQLTEHLELFSHVRNGSSHLSKDLSFLGKGLFDDDSDENEDDLFGSSKISQKLQEHGSNQEFRLFNGIGITKNKPSQEEVNTQQVQPSELLKNNDLFDNRAGKNMVGANQGASDNSIISSSNAEKSNIDLISSLQSPPSVKDQVKNTDGEGPGELLQEDHGLGISSVKNQLAARHPLVVNAVGKSLMFEEDSSSQSSSGSLDHLSQEALWKATGSTKESCQHDADGTLNIVDGIFPVKHNGNDGEKQHSDDKVSEAHDLSTNQKSRVSASILLSFNGTSVKDGMQDAKTILDMQPDTEDSCVGTSAFASVLSSSTSMDDIQNILPKKGILHSFTSCIDMQEDSRKDSGDDTPLSHPALFRPMGSSKRHAPTLVKKLPSVGISVLPSHELNQHLSKNTLAKVSENSSSPESKTHGGSCREDEHEGYKLEHSVIHEASNPLASYNDKSQNENAKKIMPTLLKTSFPNRDSVTQLSTYSKSPYIEIKALPSLYLSDEEEDKIFGPFQATAFDDTVTKQNDPLILQKDNKNISSAHSMMTMKHDVERGPALLDRGTERKISGPSKSSFHSLLFSDDSDDNDS